jgi:hypothetical protein
VNRAFDRVRSEPAPDLWPEIERRFHQIPPGGPPRRGGILRAVPVAVVVLVTAGVLVWALSSLWLRSSNQPAVSLAPGQIVRIPVGRAPQPIAADDSAAWVVTGTTDRGNVLWRIDARTDRATELPATRGAGWPVVGEGFAWVTCTGTRNPCGGNSVLKLDPETGATLATIKLPGYPFVMATGLGSVWVSTDAGLVKIDPSAARVVATFAVHTDLLGTAAGSVWATGAGGGGTSAVMRIDPTDGRILDAVGFFDACRLLATDQGVWVSSCRGGLPTGSQGDVLERIDPATGRVAYRVPVEQWGGALSLTQGWLWESRWVGDHVQIEARDPATGTLTGAVLTVEPGPQPWGSQSIGTPEVFTAVGAGSFWLTHVDSGDVVRLGG